MAKADLVLLAMGFVSPVASVLEAFGVDKDARGNAKATTDFGYGERVILRDVSLPCRAARSRRSWAPRAGARPRCCA
jgi:glutamate synthase (NADPH/NADH) small chain